MIALDRELPKECYGCPCLGTYDIPGEDGKHKLFRACSASGLKVIITREYVTGEDIPKTDEWFTFDKPEWCPWIEIK